MNKSKQEGFVSLSALMWFMVVALILVTVQTTRTSFMAREVSRKYLDNQAAWLAESAVELAMFQMKMNPDSYEAEKLFTREIAPIYIGEDPLVIQEEAIEVRGDEIENRDEEVEIQDEEYRDSRIITVEFGYEIKKIKPENLPEIAKSGNSPAQIRGMARFPYRDYKIEKRVLKLCWKDKNGRWKTVPMAQ